MCADVCARFLNGADVFLGSCSTVNDVRVQVARQRALFAPQVVLLTMEDMPGLLSDDQAEPPPIISTILISPERNTAFWRATLTAHALGMDASGLVRVVGAGFATEELIGESVHDLIAKNAPASCVRLLLGLEGKAVHCTREWTWGHFQPLYAAACRNNYETVKLLLEFHADANHGAWSPSCVGGSVSNALRAACKLGYCDVVRLLVSHQASVGECPLTESALVVAWKAGHRDICEFLVTQGADVNEVCRRDYAAGVVSVVRLGTIFSWDDEIRQYLEKHGGRNFIVNGCTGVQEVSA